MYGVVLMMALGGGADAPAMSNAAGEHVARYGDNGHKEYRCFGRGCSGGGCSGGYGGGYGGGCYGGYGGGCYGGYRGGCYGGYGGGCYGGGCSGGYRSGGYGYGGYGMYGGDGGYYGSMPYATNYYVYSNYGTPMYYGSTGNNYGYGLPVDQGDRRYYDERGQAAEQVGAPQARGEAPATLTVRLPADAKLTVDGSGTKSTETVRVFISPPLQSGKEYQYTLKAEVTRDGKKVERTRDVTVRAGQQSEVTFDLPADDGSSRK